jgi:DNA-binding CsgD family transcriptional regulator
MILNDSLFAQFDAIKYQRHPERSSTMPQEMSANFVDARHDFLMTEDKASFLKNLGKPFGISNITYFSVKAPSTLGKGNRLLTTYSKEWQSHYLENNYACVDPVIAVAAQAFLPVDWAEVSKNDSNSKIFFGDAADFGILPQGVTIPVRGLVGETTLVSLHSNASPSEWKAIRSHMMADLVYFSHLLHEAILTSDVDELAQKPVYLTRRERQVLMWAAYGKTYWETGHILGLSERTVGFYMKNAMGKLSVATKCQAVAKAIVENHIPHNATVDGKLPAEP